MKLKFGVLVGLYEYYVKICPLGGFREISSSQFLFWDPLHISETNGARRLKFGTLVGI